jgi:hypothetical protein
MAGVTYVALAAMEHLRVSEMVASVSPIPVCHLSSIVAFCVSGTVCSYRLILPK